MSSSRAFVASATSFGVYLAAAGKFPATSNILTWVLNNKGSYTKRGTGLALLQMIGQCGSRLGPRLYSKNKGPVFVKGMTFVRVHVLQRLLAFMLRMLLA